MPLCRVRCRAWKISCEFSKQDMWMRNAELLSKEWNNVNSQIENISNIHNIGTKLNQESKLQLTKLFRFCSASCCFSLVVAFYRSRSIFRPIRKITIATISFVMSVRPSVCMEQLGLQWTNFHEMWVFEYFSKIYRQNRKRMNVTLH
jgi:hypothetical protein